MSQDEAPPQPAGDPVRVVLVDDDHLVRERLTEVLERSGIRVVAAARTVREGIAAVTEHRPDVAVIDNRLPDGRGVDLCAALMETLPEVPLVLHSAFVSPDEERAAIAAGVAAIVPKSVRPAGLIEAVHRHGRPASGQE